MQQNKKPAITIIGAGIAGCFLAILLAKRGFKIHIYERASHKEITENASSRSFNLTFYSYGVSVLKKAGIWEAIEPTLIRTIGSITQVTEHPRTERFNPTGVPQYVVGRALILKTLMEEANRLSNVSFHFSTNLIAVDRWAKTILIQDLISKEYMTRHCDVVFGADGVNSQVRIFLQQAQQAKHTQEYAQWEYKQLSFTPERVKELQLQHTTIYAWTRKYAAILAHPNPDNSFSALLIMPKDPKRGFASLTEESTIERFIKTQFSDLLPALPEIKDDILTNPVGHFVTIYTQPWYYKDFLVLVGDAAHGFSPFYGQGMSAAFGDCMELVTLIDKYENDWKKIFSSYQKNRKRHMDALADLSKETLSLYVRHKKADYNAIYNKLESVLFAMLPTLFPSPPSLNIANDPGHTADYVERHRRQRTVGKFLGVSLLVHIATAGIALQENVQKLFEKKR